MNRIHSLCFLLALSTGVFSQPPVENYSFRFRINNLPDSIDSVAFLANYYGSRQYYKDTAYFNKGAIEFSGKSIPGGIYSVILEDRKNYFEFVVNEPEVEMETDFGDLVKRMKVKVSNENKNFYEYLQFINEKSKEAEPLQAKMKELEEGGKAKKAKKTEIQEQLSAIEKDVIAYKKQFINDHPDLFISKVFKATADPDVPDFTEIADEDERKRKRFNAFRKHYLDDVDFSDERLLRTPVLHNKMMHYVTKLTPQSPDSIIAAADYIVERARANQEVFKYAVHTITNKYENTQIMGMDAVLVHMGEKYYCSGEAYWMSEKKLKEFCERVEAMKPLLIGNRAPNLILPDTSGQWRNLYEIEAPFTILYFWDSSCGHCKKVTPKLKEFYADYRAKGVEVYAVGTEFETKDWKKYIRKNQLPWINVSDTPDANKNATQLILEGKTTVESLNFRETYDIFSTPKVFLLDEDKTIIATKLSPEQIGDYIDHMLEQKRKASEKATN